MRCRGEKQLVLEMRADLADGLRALRVERVGSGRTRGNVVGFIDNQNVKLAQACRFFRSIDCFAKESQRGFPLQIVHGGD